MIIIQAYKGKTELTESQREVLFSKAKSLKVRGFTHMLVTVHQRELCADVIEYIATTGEKSERAYVGKRGALTNAVNGKAGAGFEEGNCLETVISQLDKYSHKVTI